MKNIILKVMFLLSCFIYYGTAQQQITGYTYKGGHNGHAYYLSNSAANWSNANTLSNNVGGHLVTIMSTEEQTFVRSIITQTVWLGLTDEVTEGVWKWVSGDTIKSNSYTNWESGEPNNVGNEDYGEMYLTGKWNDIPGGVSRYYILEFDDIIPPSVPSGLKVTETNSTKLTISWNKVFDSDVAKYKLYSSTNNSDFTLLATLTKSDSTYSHIVIKGKIYYYQISSVDAYGNESNKSTVISANTDATPPDTVRNFSAKTWYIGGVKLSWNANTEGDLKYYSLYVKTAVAQNYTNIGLFNKSTTSLNFGKQVGLNYFLENNIKYMWYVTALDTNNNESYRSNIDSMICDSEGPATPKNFKINQTKLKLKTYKMSWDSVNDGSLLDYILYGDTVSPPVKGVYGFSKNTSFEFVSTTFRSDLYFSLAARDTFYNNSQHTPILQRPLLDSLEETPTGLTLTPLKNAQVKISWNKNKVDSNNFYFYSLLINGNDSKFYKINDTVVIINGVDDGKYITQIAQQDSFLNISTYSNVISAKADGKAPSIPVGLTTITGKDIIKLTWNINNESDFKEYKLYRGLNVNNITFYKSLISTNLVDSVNNNVLYYYQLSSIDSVGNESAMSSVVYGMADNISPNIPEDFKCLSVGNKFIRLGWKFVVDTDNDLQFIRLYKNGILYKNLNKNINTFNDTLVENSIPYTYKLSSIDTLGNESEFTNNVIATPDGTPPSTIDSSGIKITIGNSNILIQWNPVLDADLDYYKLYWDTVSFTNKLSYKIDSEILSSFFIIGKDITSFLHSNLTNGQSYFYKFSTVDTSGNESEAIGIPSVTPDGTPPEIPEDLIISFTNNEAKLSWKEITEIDFKQYRLYYSTNKNQLILMDSLNTNSVIIPTENNKWYYFKLQSEDSVGNLSNFTEIVQGQYDTIPPKKPSGFISSAGNTQIYLKWLKNEEFDFETFKLHISILDTTITLNKDSLWYMVNELENETEYTFSLTSIDTAGNISDTSFITNMPKCSLMVDIDLSASISSNYPNPANPMTTIKFKLSNGGATVISLYDILGRRVNDIYYGDIEANKFYNVRVDGSNLSTGFYIYVIQNKQERIVKKLLIIK